MVTCGGERVKQVFKITEHTLACSSSISSLKLLETRKKQKFVKHFLSETSNNYSQKSDILYMKSINIEILRGSVKEKLTTYTVE